MNKELHRLLELSGVVTKSGIVNHLYENYHDSSYKEVKGFDGPFKMKNGRVVHYNVNESKYYDARTASYLNEQEVAELYKTDNKFTEGVVLNASRGGEKISLRLEGMMEMRPMVTTLKNNGYDDFEATDDNGEEIDVDNFAGGEEELEDKPASEQLQDIISKAQELTDVVDTENGIDSTWKEKLTVVDDYLSGLLSDVQGGDEQKFDNSDEFSDDSEEVSSPDMDEPRMEGKKKVNERELSKSEKEKLDRLKKKHEDSEMHKSMIDQYGKEKGDEVFYGKLTKMAKEGQENIDEKAAVESGMSKSDFIEHFKSNILPSIAKRFEKNGKPDKPARKEAWNEAIDSLMKDGKLAKNAEDWTIPRELETKNLKESKDNVEVYEIPNPSFSETLDKQIEMGVNDWKAEDGEGREAVGQSEKEARKNLAALKDHPVKKGPIKENSFKIIHELDSTDDEKAKDTSKVFSKGDKVEYQGKEKFIVVPDGPGQMVGIADKPDGKPDMVKASKVSSVLQDKKDLNESKFSKGDKVEYNGEEKFVVHGNENGFKVGIADQLDVDFSNPQSLFMSNFQFVNPSNIKSLNEGKDRDVVDWSDVKDAAEKVAKKVHGKVDKEKIDGIITNAKKHKPDSTAAAVEIVQNMIQDKKENVNENKSFSKGDKVKYNGKEKYVVITNFLNQGKIGIHDNLPTDDPKNRDQKYWNSVKVVDPTEVEPLNEDTNAVDATLWNKEAMPHNAIDDAEQKAERTGQADRDTKVKTPKEVIKAIDSRIKELESSIDTYDEKGYDEKSMKVNTIECLQQIKENLERGTYEGFMQAQIFFGTLMSPIWDLMPAQLVNYLAKGPGDEE